MRYGVIWFNGWSWKGSMDGAGRKIGRSQALQFELINNPIPGSPQKTQTAQQLLLFNILRVYLETN